MSGMQLVPAVPGAFVPVDAIFPRVLFGVDFTSASLAAARWATRYVALRADALIAHVASAFDGDDAGDDEDGDETGALRLMAPALTGGLGGFGATLDVASARSLVRFGRPSHWLSTIANGAEASLLVLGRRRDANRLRVGEPNVIERVARRTSAPVLVVPEGITAAPTRVIAAVDESAFAAKVLRVARRLARLHEIPLAVLHVLPPSAGSYERVINGARHLLGSGRKARPSRAVGAPAPLPAQRPRWLVRLEEEQGLEHQLELQLSRQVERRLDRLDSSGVVVGDAAREIAAASSSEATLVVCGKRGADDAPLGALGSVARELLTRAPAAVLALGAP